jgi:uncharacterized coiled-coil protein SlyX
MSLGSQQFDVMALLAGLLVVLNILNILYTWWRTRDQNTEARFRAGAERMDRLDTRLASVEQTLRAQPTRDDMHALHLTMKGMEGEMKVLTERLKPVEAISERLQEVLLEQSRK